MPTLIESMANGVELLLPSSATVNVGTAMPIEQQASGWAKAQETDGDATQFSTKSRVLRVPFPSVGNGKFP